MTNMPNMLAYTIRGGFYSGTQPHIVIGQGPSKAGFYPTNPVDDSYWFVFIDRNNPKSKPKDFVVPGQNNTTVPAGVDACMSNPQYIFVVTTQFLSVLHVPQGALFDYLIKFGAGRALQRIEQLAASLGCGALSRPNYILTGQGGPRSDYSPPSYELGSVHEMLYLTMSLMPLPNGQPPYSICDSLTFR